MPANTTKIAGGLEAIAADARAAWGARGSPQVGRGGRPLPCPLDYVPLPNLRQACRDFWSEVCDFDPLLCPLSDRTRAAGLLLYLLGHVSLVERNGRQYVESAGGSHG